jgi:hypothetical protein
VNGTQKGGGNGRVPTAGIAEVGSKGARVSLLCLAMILCTSIASSQEPVTISIDPSFHYLGSISTLSSLDSVLVAGTTTMTIYSPGPWQLEVQLEGPMSRTSDGLELPLQRLSETHPGIPLEIVNLQPYVIDNGSGASQPFEIDGDWLDLASGLEAYLDQGDPPGTYEITMLSRVLDGDGNPMTDYVPLTMQFDIDSWVSFETSVLPDAEISLPEGSVQGESPTILVSLTSNTSWTLTVEGTGDLEMIEGEEVLSLDGLSICTEDTGNGERPRRSGCEAVQVDPVVLVEGEAPPPFMVAVEEIPVFLTYEGSPPLPSGRFGTSLLFEALVTGF